MHYVRRVNCRQFYLMWRLSDPNDVLYAYIVLSYAWLYLYVVGVSEQSTILFVLCVFVISIFGTEKKKTQINKTLEFSSNRGCICACVLFKGNHLLMYFVRTYRLETCYSFI